MGVRKFKRKSHNYSKIVPNSYLARSKLDDNEEVGGGDSRADGHQLTCILPHKSSQEGGIWSCDGRTAGKPLSLFSFGDGGGHVRVISEGEEGLGDLCFHRHVINHAEVEEVRRKEVEPVLKEKLHRVGVVAEDEMGQHSHEALDGLLDERLDKGSIV